MRAPPSCFKIARKQVVEGYLIGVTSACFAASCRKNSLQRLFFALLA